MGRKKSNEETNYWLIPKRSSIHQVWCLIDGIKKRGVNGRVWNPTLQNDLGVNLKKWGATNDGRNISPQAMRTLTAFAQYLGFVYIDNTCTPSVIRITKAGELFWDNCRPNIVKLRNLTLDEDKSLQYSDDVKLQMEKLQLTNPAEEKKCTNILLFPFRCVLKLLLELEYLDVEELAMYVFSMRDESEYNYVKESIENFRKLSPNKRGDLVDAFKDTVLGNISLVQAPSTGYFISICERTGLICRQREVVNNSGGKVTTMRYQDGAAEYALGILKEKYNNIHPYDFGDDLRLWIQYYGNPDRIETPIDTLIFNKTKDKLLISVCDSSKHTLINKVLDEDENLSFPAFKNDTYVINVFSVTERRNLQPICYTPTTEHDYLCLETDITSTIRVETFETIKCKILEHIEAKNFAGEMAQLLRAISIQTGINRSEDKMLRGAYLESLFYEMLKIMEGKGLVNDVRWNGRYNSIGLPTPAPGGKSGTPDILFEVNGHVFVLELTTMRAKSSQEQAESTSVPDHLHLVAEQTDLPVKGIYAAPKIHDRITNMMKATALHNGDAITCVTIIDLLDNLSTEASDKLLSNLLSL